MGKPRPRLCPTSAKRWRKGCSKPPRQWCAICRLQARIGPASFPMSGRSTSERQRSGPTFRTPWKFLSSPRLLNTLTSMCLNHRTQGYTIGNRAAYRLYAMDILNAGLGLSQGHDLRQTKSGTTSTSTLKCHASSTSKSPTSLGGSNELSSSQSRLRGAGHCSLSGLGYAVPCYVDNQAFTVPDAGQEYATINLQFGQTTSKVLTGNLERLRGSLVIECYTSKNTGPARAETSPSDAGSQRF